MKTLAAILALLLHAVCADAQSTAFCYSGEVTSSYGILSEPEIQDGSLTFQSDTNLYLTLTETCVLTWDDGQKPAPSEAVVECTHNGALVHHGGANNIHTEDGILVWRDSDTGFEKFASVGCSVFEAR